MTAVTMTIEKTCDGCGKELGADEGQTLMADVMDVDDNSHICSWECLVRFVLGVEAESSVGYEDGQQRIWGELAQTAQCEYEKYLTACKEDDD